MGWRAQVRGWQAFLLMSALPLAACGGHVEGGGSSGSESDPSSSGGSKSMQPGFDPTTDSQLGDCKMGPPAATDESGKCAWVADDRCYPDRTMACNCVCPRSRDSVCLSSLDAGPDGHVPVTCD